ncbi:MAG: uracil-DNA glycosylase [Christensenellales bacterium]
MELSWETLSAAVKNCSRCRLCATRTQTVLGEGSPRSGIMFVGEGPGREEDATGRPFVGAAGQLLDKMIAAIGLKRDDVYIANIVKCRPPNNREPEASEAMSCLPYLRAQFLLVSPKIIVCLGATAAKYVYSENVRITRDRGAFINKKGVWIIPTYHPAALLRDPSKKKDAWTDFQAIRDKRFELMESGILKDMHPS